MSALVNDTQGHGVHGAVLGLGSVPKLVTCEQMLRKSTCNFAGKLMIQS